MGNKSAEQMGYEARNAEAELAPPSYDEAMSVAVCTPPGQSSSKVQHTAAVSHPGPQANSRIDAWVNDCGANAKDWDDVSQPQDMDSQAFNNSGNSKRPAIPTQRSSSSWSGILAEKRTNALIRRQERRAAIEAAVEAATGNARRRLAERNSPLAGVIARVEQTLAEKEARRREWRARFGLP